MITLAEQAEKALRVVEEAPIIGYDTETSGLDWKIHNPVGYVITADAVNNFYIPVRHGGGGNLNDPNCGPLTAPDAPTKQHAFEAALAKSFRIRRERKLLTVGHNLIFDMHSSANQGIYLGRECGDTQHNAAMLDEYRKSFSLDACAKEAGVTAKLGDELYGYIASIAGGEAVRASMEHFWQTDGQHPVVIDYSCGDGITTLELWEHQMRGIEEEEMQFIHGIESHLIWTVFRTERRGIKIDEKYIDILTEAVDKEMVEARKKLPPNFNERSGPQVRKMFENLGITDWPTTGIGNPSFPEKWLKKSDAGRAIVAIRKLSNLGNSFVVPLRDRHMFKGRVHSSLNQLKSDEFGTVSGRFSSSSPNLQQVPKRDKELGSRFRRVFIADEGMDFWEADYSQCEPRLFAHYAKEETLIDGYNAVPFRDVHQVVADKFGVERDPTAKRMNMGIFTGMQIESFAGHMGWELDRAANAFNAWFEEFSGIRKFQNQAKQVLRSRGYVKTILGRRCRMDNPRFAYRGTSKIIQGSNADIVKERYLAMDEYLESEGDIAWLSMTVHDSFNFQTPLGAKGEAISAELIRMMEDVRGPPYSLRVPFVAETGHGPDWATATYGEAVVKSFAV